ncbi:hypothetical protein [Chryseobacterium elymi]|uniref:hypothetical protein n=1 Tax=Chryseobacterium elymi TaxID=395936 RepID=UPI000F4E4BDE|nr:hypothetical protein [Chryseobacterium elymi]
MKNLKNIKGVQNLSKENQKFITGGYYYGPCCRWDTNGNCICHRGLVLAGGGTSSPCNVGPHCNVFEPTEK